MGGLDAAPCAGSLSGNHGSATPSIRSQHPGNHIMAGGAGDAPSLAASKGHFARSGKNAVTARYHDCKSDSSESGSSSGLTAVRMGRVTYVVGFLSGRRSEEHTSELQSLMRISYAVFCLKKKNNNTTMQHT